MRSRIGDGSTYLRAQGGIAAIDEAISRIPFEDDDDE